MTTTGQPHAARTLPVISVCITAYNHEKFIAQALDSVLMQQGNFVLEVLVGEDASTDRTREIVERYSDKHPDVIRAFYHSAEEKIIINGRITGRKNLAHVLCHARGEYVILLDGDDFWLDSSKLEKQVSFLEKNPHYVGCFHNAIHVDEDGVLLDRLAVGLTQIDFGLEDILQTNAVPTMSCLFRNPYYKELPDWFYKTDMGDWPIHIMNVQRGQLHYMPVVMAAYRIHDAGIWRPFRDNAIAGFNSQIQVWNILLAEANLEKDELIQSLIEKNFKRIINIAKIECDSEKLMHYINERKKMKGKVDWYYIKNFFRAMVNQNLSSKDKAKS